MRRQLLFPLFMALAILSVATIAQAAPSPEITEFELTSYGNYVTIYIEARNNGTAGTGGITVSFPDYDDPYDHNRVSMTYSSPDCDACYAEYEQGSSIYSIWGTFFGALHLMVEYSRTWEADQTIELELKVWQRPGIEALVARARAWADEGSTTYMDPESGDPDANGVDQQGWPVLMEIALFTTPECNIVLSKTSMSFSADEGDGLTNADYLTVGTNDDCDQTWYWNVTDKPSWIEVSPASGQSGDDPVVRADASDLSADTYNGKVYFSSSAVENSPQILDVTLVVRDVAEPCNMTLSKTSMAFFADVGDGLTNADYLTVQSDCDRSWYWNVTSKPAWIDVSPSAGISGDDPVIQADASGLNAGLYSGTVHFSSAAVENSPQLLTVTLRVQDETDDPISEWPVVFSDDFSESSLNTDKWTVIDDRNCSGTFSVGVSGGAAALTLPDSWNNCGTIRIETVEQFNQLTNNVALDFSFRSPSPNNWQDHPLNVRFPWGALVYKNNGNRWIFSWIDETGASDQTDFVVTALTDQWYRFRIAVIEGELKLWWAQEGESLQPAHTVPVGEWSLRDNEGLSFGSSDRGTTYYDDIILRSLGGTQECEAESDHTQPYIPDDCTVGLWHLDETGGTTVDDASPNNFDGTLHGDCRTSDGKFGGAINCDLGYMTVPANSTLDITTESFTVECWVKASNPGDYKYILQKRVNKSSTDNAQYGLYTADYNRQLSFFVARASDGGITHAYDPSFEWDGQWHHIAGVRDAEAGVLRLYVDGDERATTPFSGATELYSSSNYDLYVGEASSTTSNHRFPGMIDEVRISSGVRTFTESVEETKIEITALETPNGAVSDKKAILKWTYVGDIGDMPMSNFWSEEKGVIYQLNPGGSVPVSDGELEFRLPQISEAKTITIRIDQLSLGLHDEVTLELEPADVVYDLLSYRGGGVCGVKEVPLQIGFTWLDDRENGLITLRSRVLTQTMSPIGDGSVLAFIDGLIGSVKLAVPENTSILLNDLQSVEISVYGCDDYFSSTVTRINLSEFQPYLELNEWELSNEAKLIGKTALSLGEHYLSASIDGLWIPTNTLLWFAEQEKDVLPPAPMTEPIDLALVNDFTHELYTIPVGVVTNEKPHSSGWGEGNAIRQVDVSIPVNPTSSGVLHAQFSLSPFLYNRTFACENPVQTRTFESEYVSSECATDYKAFSFGAGHDPDLAGIGCDACLPTVLASDTYDGYSTSGTFYNTKVPEGSIGGKPIGDQKLAFNPEVSMRLETCPFPESDHQSTVKLVLESSIPVNSINGTVYWYCVDENESGFIDVRDYTIHYFLGEEEVTPSSESPDNDGFTGLATALLLDALGPVIAYANPYGAAIWLVANILWDLLQYLESVGDMMPTEQPGYPSDMEEIYGKHALQSAGLGDLHQCDVLITDIAWAGTYFDRVEISVPILFQTESEIMAYCIFKPALLSNGVHYPETESWPAGIWPCESLYNCDFEFTDHEYETSLTPNGQYESFHDGQFHLRATVSPRSNAGPATRMDAGGPVGLSIKDPSGNVLSQFTNTIPDGLVAAWDVGGEEFSSYYIPTASLGEYLIRVLPRPEAVPTDLWNLNVFTEYGEYKLIGNLPILLLNQFPMGLPLTINISDQDLFVNGNQVFAEHSPVSLVITDDSGNKLSSTEADIPGSIRTWGDIDGDGDIEGLYRLPYAPGQSYNIQIIPDDNAAPSDSFKIEWRGPEVSDTATIVPYTYISDYDFEETIDFYVPITFDAFASTLPTSWSSSWLTDPRGTVRAYVGNIAGEYSAEDIDPATILLNDEVPIYRGRSRVRPSMTGFNGSVLEISFSRQLAVQSLGEDAEAGTHTVIITGEFTDGNKFISEVEITLDGTPPAKIAAETDQPTVPTEFSLGNAYPNPFNPTTTIEFGVPRDGNVKIEVYNITGQKVKTLTNKHYTAGSYTVEWNSTDDSGNEVATGVYLYRMTASDFTETKKMVLMK